MNTEKGGGDIKNLKEIPFNSVEVLKNSTVSVPFKFAYNNTFFKNDTYVESYSKDEKIKNIWNSQNKIAKLRLIYFLQKKSGGGGFTLDKIDILKTITDAEFLKQFIQIYPISVQAEIGRGKNKAEAIYDSFLKFQYETDSNYEIKSIMDIACGEGYITDALRKLFNIENANTLGLEIDKDYVTNEIKTAKAFDFIHYYSLPGCVFPNIEQKKKYDLIMIILGLHHFNDPKVILKQISLSLNDGGLLLIRDHNVINCFDLMLVELEHIIPDFQRGATGDCYGCYRSSYSQDELLKLFGFELVYTNFLTEDKYNETERNIHTTNINDRFYKKINEININEIITEETDIYTKDTVKKEKYVVPNRRTNTNTRFNSKKNYNNRY